MCDRGRGEPYARVGGGLHADLHLVQLEFPAGLYVLAGTQQANLGAHHGLCRALGQAESVPRDHLVPSLKRYHSETLAESSLRGGLHHLNCFLFRSSRGMRDACQVFSAAPQMLAYIAAPHCQRSSYAAHVLCKGLSWSRATLVPGKKPGLAENFQRQDQERALEVLVGHRESERKNHYLVLRNSDLGYMRVTLQIYICM